MATTPATRARTPLWAVLSLSFLASLGTGGVMNGIFFLTPDFGFDRRGNFWLALLMGGAYVLAAGLSGRLLRLAARRATWLNPRAVLGLMLGAIGAACCLPQGVAALTGGPRAWTVWVLIVVFSLATGLFWPVTEGFLSGGRKGTALRSAVGRFNIVWASSLVVAFWAMAPLVAQHPRWVLVGLGVAHWVAGVLLAWFPAEPASVPPDALGHEPHPESYRLLLKVFRVMLPVTYVVLSTLSPFFPRAVADLGVPVAWYTPVVSVWLVARVSLFVVFERWHGWHGRWWPPVAGWLALMGGFAACVGGPAVGGTGGLTLFLGGLVGVGVGMAVVYVGSLYYGMEVGHAQVDAGGAHEALIGLGYTIGPACGLGALWVTQGSPERFEAALILGVVAVCLALTGGGIYGVTRRTDRVWVDPPVPGR